MATPGVKDGSGVLHNRWVMLAVLTTARLALGFQFQSVGSTAPFRTSQAMALHRCTSVVWSC